MVALLIFAVALLAAVLFSELAGRSILSSAVLFLFFGFIAGNGVLRWIDIQPQDRVVRHFADLALFSILFSDGMRAGIRDIASAWRLPGRALLLGLPLTLLATALLAKYVAGVAWLPALLLGAILCPTDPAFAASIIGRKEIPRRLRSLLNVESGINDGLALPIVLALLSLVSGQSLKLGHLGGELLGGIALGVVIPWAACYLERSRGFGIAAPNEPLFVFAVGLLVLGLAALTHGNIYLAAFAGGITIATVRPDLRDEFHQFGGLISELLKLAALLLFAALIAPSFFSGVGIGGYLFALLAIFLARPFALLLALLGSSLDWRERIIAAWFGPKGFASVIYGLLLLDSAVDNAEHLFHLIALAIVVSIIAHSSTDAPIARLFRQENSDRHIPKKNKPAR